MGFYSCSLTDDIVIFSIYAHWNLLPLSHAQNGYNVPFQTIGHWFNFTEGRFFSFSFQPSDGWAVCSLPRLNTYLHLPFFFSLAGLWLCILHFWTFYFRRQTKWCMHINRIKRQHVRAISRAGKRNSLHTRRHSRFAHINANISLCVPFFEYWAF